MKKEAKARIKINKLLEEAGWRFFDDDNGRANIQLEVNIKIKKNEIKELGEDFEGTKNGFIDFLLLDENGYPLVVLEAKSEDKNPLDGKEQARTYANSINARYVLLSNGNLSYIWDLKRGNPEIITAFPTQDSLRHAKKVTPNRSLLYETEVNADYVALTQNPYFAKDHRWKNEDEREDYVNETGLRILRHYQVKAVRALQRSVNEGNDRFLFEMATGTGKTLVAAAVIKLFLKTGNASRVLFLVDRLELENQAWRSFSDYLKNDAQTVIYKDKRDDWRKAEIVVSTVQSFTFNNKYMKLFSPTDFDLIISDEAHRSINGNARAVFEYFVGYKLGLTATPKDYIKNLEDDKISEMDPRKWERRQLLDTYITFGCEKRDPTFRYSMLEGVKDGYLISPIVADGRTRITTQLLSDEGYSVIFSTPEDEDEEVFYYRKDFEKKFFSKKTNAEFCKVFIENALCDPITREIGKSIVFCVSQNHARKITQILNAFADEYFPGKYNSDFALQITSVIPDAQQYAMNFANNNLRGYTRFAEGYKSSRTRVCVTVGMMTTGYDCRDLMNIGMMRPIFSPTDFIQIKGRGTRTFTFKYGERGEEVSHEKEHFKILDFFANCEYFEEKFKYDEVLKLPPKFQKVKEPREYGGEIDEEYISKIADPLKTFKETTIGPEGMKIDRMLFQSFEEKVKEHDFVGEKVAEGDFDAAEDIIREEIFDKPEEYFNLPKLRKALNLDRRVSLREIIEKIYGYIDRFKTAQELLDDENNKFVSIYKPDAKYIPYIKGFLSAYLTDIRFREIIEKREYAKLATYPGFTLNDLNDLNNFKDLIPEYVKDNVPLNNFMN